MPITVKSPREIELMTEAGRILEIVHNELGKALHPGMTTKEIDELGEEIIRSYDCIPSFLDYNGYPASICVSVNDEVVHGIPSPHRFIREGDIVSLDAGVIYKGYHSDAARTHGIGRISKEAEELIRVTRECFFEGIKYAREGNHLFEMNRKGVLLKAGMTLAIEPMINIGGWEVDWLDDDWTVVTRDHSLSAHYENTVLITENGPKLLSLTDTSGI